MPSREFLEQVDWETNIYDVVLVLEETEEIPAQWRVTVKPKDQNDIGSDIPIEIDYYLIDNMGNQFRIIDNLYLGVAGNILVSDDFRCGWCPQPDLTGLIVKSVGNGAAPHVSSAKLDRLDSIAKTAIQNREKDILWKYPKDINEKWHPEGLLFTADPIDQKIINYVAGKIFITLWPDNLKSDYVVDNVLLHANYHPERIYTVAASTYTCVDDTLHYIYAKLPLLASETTATIVIEKIYRFERYYDGFLTILMGTYTIPDENGKRMFLMDWNGERDKEDTGIIVTQIGHSFIFGNTIKRDGLGNWILSKADTRANAGTVGIVSEIIDADHFRYVTGGLLPGTFVDGADYWLSTTTDGAIFIQSDPEVWEIGNVREFIGTGTATGLEIEIDLGDEITEAYNLIADVVAGEINNNTQIQQTIRTISSSGNHESHLIEHTTNISETVVSLWSVIPYAERVGEFKAMIMVRNKVTNTIKRVLSILSFDYSDATVVSLQSDLLTDATINLTVGVNGSNMLYATVSVMPTDAKRIHFCFERCVLSQREWLIYANNEMGMTMAVQMSSVELVGYPGSPAFEIGMTMEAVLSAYLNIPAEFSMAITMAAVVSNGAITPVEYGALYNGMAVKDSRNLANTGWHIATESDYDALISYLGGISVAGDKLREVGTAYWNSPNTGATNEVVFNSRGAGLRGGENPFGALKSENYLMSGTIASASRHVAYRISRSSSSITKFVGTFTGINDYNGCSVRLVKDASTLTHGQTGIYTGNDGKNYRTICINGIEWMADNLLETKYRNGDWIHGYDGGVYTPVDNATWYSYFVTVAAMCFYEDNEANG